MNVVMVVSNPLTTDNRIRKEALTLSDNGFKIKILTWNYNRDLSSFNEKGIELESFNLESPRGTSNLILTYIGLLKFQLWAFIKLFKSDFDVVHCIDFDTVPSGFLAGKLKRKNVVVDILDFYFTFPLLERNTKVLRFISKLLRGLEIFFVKRADFLIVTTSRYKEYYLKLAPKKPITVVSNSPELNFSKSLSNHNKDDDFVISFIGSIRYAKQISRLIRVTKNIPNTKVVIAGGGVRATEIKRFSRSYSHVVFHDVLPYSKVAEIYNSSNCIYAGYDIRDENTQFMLPVKVLESMAFGIPTIVAKNTYAGDFVEENRIGLAIDVNQDVELEKSISILKNDKILYNEFKSNGMRLFREKFNWEETSKGLIEVYKRLAESA